MKIPLLKIIKVDMSGEIFPEKYFDEIMDFVKKNDITHIFVYSFNRLSRSFPLGVYLVYTLWKNDVQIVTRGFTPDHTKHAHRIRVWMELLFSEMEHGGISENTRRGIIHKLKKGIYFREKPPWGYEKIGSKLFLIEKYKPIIIDIFDFFISTNSYAKVCRTINKKYEKILDEPLTKSNIYQIIHNRIYSGYYSYDGLLIGEDGEDDKPRPELQAVDEEIFQKANEIAWEKRNGPSKSDDLFSYSVEEWMDKYGPGYVVDYMDCLTWRCPECHSTDLKMNGSQVRNGTAYKLFYCKDCNHHFRVSTATQIKHFTSIQPHRCMNCGTVDKFIVEDSQLSEYYRAVCKECGFEALVRKDKNFFSKNTVNKTKI